MKQWPQTRCLWNQKVLEDLEGLKQQLNVAAFPSICKEGAEHRIMPVGWRPNVVVASKASVTRYYTLFLFSVRFTCVHTFAHPEEKKMTSTVNRNVCAFNEPRLEQCRDLLWSDDSPICLLSGGWSGVHTQAYSYHSLMIVPRRERTEPEAPYVISSNV